MGIFSGNMWFICILQNIGLILPRKSHSNDIPQSAAADGIVFRSMHDHTEVFGMFRKEVTHR